MGDYEGPFLDILLTGCQDSPSPHGELVEP